MGFAKTFDANIKGEYGGAVVCLGVGLTLNFRCKYQLGETVVSSAVDVSGHDDDFDAEGTGKIQLIFQIFNFQISTKILRLIKIHNDKHRNSNNWPTNHRKGQTDFLKLLKRK